MTNHLEVADLMAENAALREALERIAAIDPNGLRADDMGRAARIASLALSSRDRGSKT